MAATGSRQWGVTPPISTVLPTQDELVANDDLIAELKAQNNFEPPSDSERRIQMLQLLQRVALEFVKTVSRKKGLSPAAVEASGGKIFTFGGYRLGVYGPGKLRPIIRLSNSRSYPNSPCLPRIRYRYPDCRPKARMRRGLFCRLPSPPTTNGTCGRGGKDDSRPRCLCTYHQDGARWY
jgi:hypothetical protein